MTTTSTNRRSGDFDQIVNFVKRASRRWQDNKKSFGSLNIPDLFDPKLNLLIQDKTDEQMMLAHENCITDKYKCECSICKGKNKAIVFEETVLPVKKRSILVQEERDLSFADLLRVLISETGAPVKRLKFLIADTLIFQSKEPQALIYNSKDKHLRVIRKSERSLLEMLKFFQSRQLKKNQLGADVFNENTITMRVKIQKAIEKAKNETKEEDSITQPERASPTLAKKEKKVFEATVYHDIAICKHKDGSLQLLNEFDFSSLMMKKRVESIWSKFDYIQGYIKLKPGQPTFIKVEYDHDRDSKSYLFIKARNYIYYLKEEKGSDIPGFEDATDEDYFEEKLKTESINKYCQYLTYKFVNYLDAYFATRIKRMICEYAWEDTNLVYLSNASKTRVYGKNQADDYILQEVQIVNEQERQNALNRLVTKKKVPSKEKEYMLWACSEYYKEVKNDMGIEKAFEEPSLENPDSNKAFKQLNPDPSFTLYDVMTDQERFEEFQAWVKHRETVPQSFTGLNPLLQKPPEPKSNTEVTQTHRRIKSSAVQFAKKPISSNIDCTRAFLKKKKALDICGNGVARKRVEFSEVQYGMSLNSGRRLVSTRAPSMSLSKDWNEHLTPKSPVKFDCSPIHNDQFATARQFASVSPKNASFLSQSSLGKAGSLTSILYMKPTAPSVPKK